VSPGAGAAGVEVDLSVVVPVYNNAATLGELIDRLLATLDPLPFSFELIFVDDGSSDASFELLRARAAAEPRVRAYALKRNYGSQGAICAGFDLVRGKRTVCLDADLENFPEDIPALLAALDRGYELACGVREMRRSPLWRRVPSAVFNAFVRRQIGTTVRDIGCGMRAMDSRVVHQLASEGEKRRLVTPLLLKRARSVVEVPIRHQPSGAPSHSFLTLLGIAFDFYLLTARRPFLVAGLLSVAGALAGAGVLAAALLRGGAVLALTGAILAVAGLLGGLLSLLGEYVQRTYQLGQGLPFYELRPREAEGESPPGEEPSTRRRTERGARD
jgi:glycosyltransferase involved in cell wall biosynthesis